MPSRLFWILTWRFYLSHPVRWGLCVLGVAAGVAVSTAINLTGQQAVRSFSSSIETLTGVANLRVAVPGGLEPEALEKLAFLWETGRFTPYIFRPAAGGGRALELYGFDLLGDRRIRSFRFATSNDKTDEAKAGPNGAAPRAPGGPDPRSFEGLLVPIGSPLGNVGDRVELVFDARRHSFPIVGLLEKVNGRLAPPGHVYADLGLLLPLTGRLSGVDVFCRESDLDHVRARLNAIFPAANIQTLSERQRITSDLLGAFRMNLQALGLVALLVSAYLVYNTVHISVLQRRRQISSLLALGAEPAGIYRALLAEGAFLGLCGGVPGILGGLAASRLAYAEVSATVSTVYGMDQATPSGADPLVLFVSLLIGIVFALFAALVPARRAAAIAPSLGMRAGFSEYRPGGLRRAVLLAGLFGLAGTLLIYLAFRLRDPLPGIMAVFACTACLSFLAPLAVRALVLLWSVWPGAGARLAAAALLENIGRVSVAVAALLMALGLAGAVAIMVFSFRGTVSEWLARTIAADIYVKSIGAGDQGFTGALDPVLPARFARVPGVAAVRTMRIVRTAFRSGEVDVAGTELRVLADRDSLSFVTGGPDDLSAAARGEGALVSEVLANRYGVSRGDRVRIAGRETMVLAVFRNFSSERGFVFLDLSLFSEIFGRMPPEGAGIYLEKGADGEDVLIALREQAGQAAVEFAFNQEIRSAALKVFDRTFRLTGFLQIISFLIAVLAVMMTLISMVLERRREMATLVALGARAGRLYLSLVQEAFLLALAALLLAAPGSFMFAQILIQVVNRFSFGWTIQSDVPWALLAGTCLVVLSSAFIAALGPAFLIGRQNVARAIRAEEFG